MSVVVVGAGLAGSSAALALAEAGLEVVQIAAAPGATALSAGTLDVAGASPGIPTLPWRDVLRGSPLLPRERLALHRRGAPSHPYAQLFGAAEDASLPEREIEVGVARLKGWLAPVGLALAGSLGANRLLPTVPGTLRVADFAFAPAAHADLLGASELAVVDVPGLEGFDARALARTLAREIEVLGLEKLAVSVVHPRLPERLFAEASPARVAARLDGAEARAALVSASAGLGGEGGVLLFPPVLGIRETPALVEALERASGARVGEALAFPPHALAGFRLQRALDTALAAAGVRRVSGRVRRIAASAGDALRLVLDERASEARSEAKPSGDERREARSEAKPSGDERREARSEAKPSGDERREARSEAQPSGDESRNWVSLEAEAIVLATGRFASGGLGAGPENVSEPLLGLPLYDADGRRIDGSPARRSARKGYGNEQPLYNAGVRTDRRLRPLTANGRPQHGRLFAAGDLLGGFDPARERTGLGVALVSGLRAARAASEALRSPARAGDVP